MPPRPGVWGVSAIPTASVALFVAMVGVMALQLSHPIAAKRGASEEPGMELRLESREERGKKVRASRWRKAIQERQHLAEMEADEEFQLTVRSFKVPHARA